MLYFICSIGLIIHLVILNILYFTGVEFPTWIGLTYLPWFIASGMGLLINYIEKKKTEKMLSDLIASKVEDKKPIKIDDLDRL